MSDHQVTCINKSDRYDPRERILSIGGPNPDGSQWRLTQQEAIAGIDSRKWSFYVGNPPNHVWVIVATSRYGLEDRGR